MTNFMTNFEFDDVTQRNHLALLGDRIPFNDHMSAAIRTSHAFVDGARKLGYLWLQINSF
jgi:hypothetical protein